MKQPVFWLTVVAALIFSKVVLAGGSESSVRSSQERKFQLAFIQNKGQVVDQYGKYRADIDYKLETPGMSIFVGEGQLHYQWYQQEKVQHDKPEIPEVTPVEMYRLDVALVGANIKALVVEDGQGEQYYNY